MASKIFSQLVSGQMKPTGQHEAELEEAAERKGVSLEGVFLLRAKNGLSDDAIDYFFDRADYLIDQILNDMANEDIENLPRAIQRASKKSKTKVKGSLVLRDRAGRFISPIQLERLLNMTLYTYARRFMGTEGQLVNRTGRLAHSGVVTHIDLEGGDIPRLSFFYTYMLYPYEVFHNPAYPHLNPTGQRSPDKLFADAIQSAVRELLAPSSLAVFENGSVRFIKEGGNSRYER